MALVLTLFLCLYRTDAELRDTMIKVEESIDAGKLRMKPEVGAWQCLLSCIAPASAQKKVSCRRCRVQRQPLTVLLLV